MARRRQEIEAFVRHLVVEVEAAEAAGMTAPQAIADHFNTKGVTCTAQKPDPPTLAVDVSISCNALAARVR